MDAGLNALFAATLFFVGGHFLLSSEPLRSRLVESLGDSMFRGLYGLVMLAAFAAMLAAYDAAPQPPIWSPPPVLKLVPVLVMPVATVLLVAAVTTPNPTMVGGEKVLDGRPESVAVGILTVTRHPFLWATTLWAASHLFVRGDAASIILLVGILVLSLGGMAHIDKRREAALGSDWGPVALTTSRLPFKAVLQGRCKLDLAGIGWKRVLGGLALYALLLPAHGWVLGVPIL
ncbi:MAG: NnrU family protein [Kiloniellales bacterium]|nr:NnrU family protein [Kiloniellales bacterium]